MPDHFDVTAADLPVAPPTEIELSIPEMFAFAMRLHREDRLDGAEKCYRSILQLEPNNANSLHFLGVLLGQRGAAEETLALVRKSIEIDPMVASWHNNLGNLLLDAGQYQDAAAAFARCSELDPNNLEVLNNVGVLLRHLQRPQEAEDAFKRALILDPLFIDAHNNLANLYCSLNRIPEAMSHLADVLTLRPAYRRAHRLLTMTLGQAGRFAEGLKACENWLEKEPDSAEAKHFLAAFGGAVAPERASDEYVVAEFDSFAKSFDAKLELLDYKAPQWVGASVERLLGEPDRRHIILDAGCGTGLCGPFLRPYAQQLVGVDLSANMLERARARGELYDELVKVELVAYLEGCDSRFDVVVSADTLCYFGGLTRAFTAVKQALRDGGHWVFTVEAHALGDDYKLHTHGRYSHARAYVESELARAGFAAVEIKPVELRFERGEPVAGWLVSAR